MVLQDKQSYLLVIRTYVIDELNISKAFCGRIVLTLAAK